MFASLGILGIQSTLIFLLGRLDVMLYRSGRLGLLHAAATYLSLFFMQHAVAWHNEVSGGVGYGKESNRGYNYVGFIANDVFLNKQLDPKLHFLMDGSVAYWHANTSSNQNLATGAMSLDFRAYFINPMTHRYRPFIQVACGPAYLSSETFGTKRQGMKFAFQDRVGAGIEMGPQTKAFVLALELVHYSNAGLKQPNPGFTIPFIVSLGYQI